MSHSCELKTSESKAKLPGTRIFSSHFGAAILFLEKKFKVDEM